MGVGLDRAAAAPGQVRIGLDIGGTKIHAVLLHADGSILAEHRQRTGWGDEAVLAGAVEASEHLLASTGLGSGDVAVVGVGVPGTVDHRAGVVTQALNLGVEHLPLADLLSRRLSVPVHVENDVNAAALGVAVSRPSGPSRSLAYLNLGTGLAAGFVLDGALWRGFQGAAGEIGHLPLDPTGPLCTCGQRGCLETMASGSGIAKQWRLAGERNVPKVKELVALAPQHPLAREILDRLYTAVATAVRLLVLTVDVEQIVIGGGVSRIGDHLLTPVVERLRGWEAESQFLRSLSPSTRVALLTGKAPVAAVGAALAGAVGGRPDGGGADGQVVA